MGKGQKETGEICPFPRKKERRRLFLRPFLSFLLAGPVGHLRAGEGVPPSTRSLCIKEGGALKGPPPRALPAGSLTVYRG